MDISCILFGQTKFAILLLKSDEGLAQSFLYLVPQFPCNTRNCCDKTESIVPYNKGKTAHENLNQPGNQPKNKKRRIHVAYYAK